MCKQVKAQCVGQALRCEPDSQIDLGQFLILAIENNGAITLDVQPALGVVVQGIAIAALDVAEAGLQFF